MIGNQSQVDSVKVISAAQDSYRQYMNPASMGENLWAHRELTSQFAKREVLQRYKGSFLGIIWSFITPLATLAVYTFVFSVILQASWPGPLADSHAGYALAFFAGLIAFTVFSETLLAAPTLIISNPNYVKKVVFPLEILPLSVLGAALVHSLFGLIILLIGELIFINSIPWTIIFLPLMYLPLIFLSLGCSWFIASLGVFIRDIEHLLGVALQLLFFLTPIVYPLVIVPEQFQVFYYLNPLVFIVNHFRRVLLWGQMPDWGEYLLLTAATFVVCMLGYVWFMKSKKTFADVV